MDPNTLVALTVAAGATTSLMGTILAPIVLMWLTSRERRREKLEDYERQDQVAAKAEKVAIDAAKASKLLADNQREIAVHAAEAAKLLLENQQSTLARTDEVARVAAATATDHQSQLKQIHILVNSDMTAARQGELDQTRITLVMLKKIVAMNVRDNRPPNAEDLTAILTTEARINELQAILADRLVQTKAIEAEAKDASP